MHRYTKDQITYLENHALGISNKELTNMFNATFNTDLSIKQISAAKKNRKISSGLTGRFEKGHKLTFSYPKGQCAPGCEKTWFKKGNIPPNHKIVGSERISKDGYIEIKTEEPNKWELKHRVVWKKHRGEIPKSYAVLFIDGNKRNTHIDNLLLVSRAQLAIINKHKIRYAKNTTNTALLIADIYLKIGEKRKK